MNLITTKEACLLIIDVQEKIMYPIEVNIKTMVVGNIKKLISLSKILNIPILLTEQYQKGLGPTMSEIREVLPSYNPIDKISFSCFQSELFVKRLKGLAVKTLILTGIETHICVHQTAMEALNSGYGVHIVSDAVCSRHTEDHRIALSRLRMYGAVITSFEMVAYELLKRAGTTEFKEARKFLL